MEKGIIEGNKLIVEFMGLVGYNEKGHLYEYGYYHQRWDYLMEVVEKIQSIEITPPPNYKGYRIEIVVQGYVKIEGSPMPTIFTNVSKEGSLIKAVWQAVVQFIQWFTNNLTTKTEEK